MALSDTPRRNKILLDPQPTEVGGEWYVKATYPSGQVEQIMGFKTEVEAKDWIASKSKEWL